MHVSSRFGFDPAALMSTLAVDNRLIWRKILGMVSVQPIDAKTFKVTVTGTTTTTHTVSLTNASNSD